MSEDQTTPAAPESSDVDEVRAARLVRWLIIGAVVLLLLWIGIVLLAFA